MRIRILFILSLSFIALVVSGCGNGGSSNSGTAVSAGEVWTSANTSTTLNKDTAGNVTASGKWEIPYLGYTISGEFVNGTAIVTKTSLTIKGSGAAKVTGTPPIGIKNPTFIITGTGDYVDGAMTSSTFTVDFSGNGNVIPEITISWGATRQSSGDITFAPPVGTYSGTFSGGDTGSWQFTLDKTGDAEGTITSANYKKTTYFFGTYDLDGLDNSITLSNSLDSSTVYRGKINSITGYVSGTWNNPNPHINTSGSFTGSRQ